MNSNSFPRADSIEPVNQPHVVNNTSSRGWTEGDPMPSAPPTLGVLGKGLNWLTGWYDMAYADYERDMALYDQYQAEARHRREVAENWDMLYHTENYNSMANQVKQLEEAGLSRYLMYSSNPFQASSGFNPPSYQDYHTDRSQKADMSMRETMDLASFAIGLESTMLQNEYLESQIESQFLDNGIKSIQKELLGYELNDAPDKYTFTAEERAFRRKMFDKEFEKVSEEIAQLKSEREYREFLRKYGLDPHDPAWARFIALCLDSGPRGKMARRLLGGVLSSLSNAQSGAPMSAPQIKSAMDDSTYLESLSLPTDPDWWKGRRPDGM